jgi:hypothetical protein
MQTLKSLISQMNRKAEPGIVRVQPSDSGFVALWENGTVKVVKWSEVERIYTYKVDCYAYDMIWLAFEGSEHDGAVHVREEAEGFQDLMSAMGKAFNEINPEWYFNVMQPPFAEQLTVLFKREA